MKKNIRKTIRNDVLAVLEKHRGIIDKSNPDKFQSLIVDMMTLNLETLVNYSICIK